jgi:hypothetical protein
MKLNEITKGNWRIQNLDGVMKNFKNDEAPDARAWMRNRGAANQKWNAESGAWEAPEPTDKQINAARRRMEREEGKSK